MKTNKKLKLSTKKVVILSTEQQEAIQGGTGMFPKTTLVMMPGFNG